MNVAPRKGMFFIATALMYAASLYGAQSLSATDPMTRIFVGQPTQLTVPPGFYEALTDPAPSPDCTPELDGADIRPGQSMSGPPSESQPCSSLTADTVDPVEPASTPSTPSAKARVIAQPANAAATVERP